MQMTINIDYDQLSQLVRQLPPADRERLFSENGDSAPSDTTPGKPRRKPLPPAKILDDEYYEMLMNLPVISDEEVERMQEAREEINKCFQRAV